jgi:predicted nucleic acid-binding protein
MRRVYIETSVWGMVAPGQSPALQEPTVEFLDQCAARKHQPYISAVVADELRQAGVEVQQVTIAKLGAVDPHILAITPASEALAERFLREGVLPPRRLDDARHVACALVHEIDLLVSWNYRHIANVRKAEAFNAIAVLSGLRGALEIHTPLEVLEWT